MTSRDAAGDAAMARLIARWFKAAGRPLPWRTQPRNAYHSLVSEFMLQQTQVTRVLDKYPAFIASFPTVSALAKARTDRVLSHWSGLGYYRRARNLHNAAKEVVTRFEGTIPHGVADLLTLPGIGRYTAGAISSIAFHKPEPIVDGNVSRVLMRIRGKAFAHGSPSGLAWAWKQAEQLVRSADASRLDPALLNEGLMELGAVVCTPRNPVCDQCPVSRHCQAFRLSIQNKIPRSKAPAVQSRRFCEAVVISDAAGRLLVEKRPDSGMWAGLWQAPTWERADRAARAAEVANWIGAPVVRRSRFHHGTSHRDVRFTVWQASEVPHGRHPGRRFVSRARIANLALSSPQRRILLSPER